ncbi:tetratricopeptide repeat protein [Ferrovum sp. PN-J185]|uniref:tetratricopeptide repeat protein n=1 Tax=Ferrovum sp. PN-J185 TaxID=1356306 RepID=UPI00079C5F00|nr:tetratricopeptide repeat protein [Ferrovum sp. PN-J185]KXW55633.1 beta-barrel assembly-enhancing protease [Ferrovum sp. PN-J185]
MRFWKKGLLATLALTGFATPVFALDVPNNELTSKRMFEFFLGEIAAQQGQFDIAIGEMTELAQDTKDPRIAQRATEMALYAKHYPAALTALDLWLTEEPNAAEAHQILSALLFTNVAQEDLAKTIKDWLATNTNGVDEMFDRLTPPIVQMHDANQSYKLVQNITEDYDQSPAAQYLLAITAFQAGQTDDALAAVNHLLDIKGDSEKAAMLKGQILGHTRPQDALDFYQQYLNQYPNAQTVRLSYARELVNQKQFKQARDQFSYLVQKNPRNADIKLAVALLTLQLKDYGSAMNQLNDLLSQGASDPSMIHYYLGGAEEDQKHWQLALDQYAQVKEGDQYFNSQVRMAIITAKQKDLPSGLDILHRLRPQDDQEAEQLMYSEEEMRRDAGDIQGAYNLLGHALKHQPENVNMLYEQAILADRLNRFDVVEDNLKRVIAIRPNYAQAYNALGYSMTERGLKLDEAKRLIEKALTITPDDPFILDSLGWVNYRLGNNAEALHALKKAYALQEDPEIAAHLGEVLWKSDSQDEAKQVWQKSLSLHPDNAALKDTMHRFIK